MRKMRAPATPYILGVHLASGAGWPTDPPSCRTQAECGHTRVGNRPHAAFMLAALCVSSLGIRISTLHVCNVRARLPACAVKTETEKESHGITCIMRYVGG
jgi:hypothetical protein